MGLIYKRGKIFWIKYYNHGKPFCESSHSKKQSAAMRLLKRREGQIEENRFPGLRVETILFDELAQDLKNDYQINGRKSIDRIELSIRNLKRHLERFMAMSITTDQIQAYIISR